MLEPYSCSIINNRKPYTILNFYKKHSLELMGVFLLLLLNQYINLCYDLNMNQAYIDGQNLYLGTTSKNWKIDLYKFRIYLKEKYNVREAYYFLGYLNEDNQDLYNDLQKAGFIVVFREHSQQMVGKKKGNVDTEIVFSIMRSIIEKENFEKIVLVSGDGDYKRLVDFLIKKERFEKILFPNLEFASSLYKKLGNKYFVNLERSDIRKDIEYRG